MSESPVFLFDGNDPQMQRAHENARSTFRYFWREMSWERRRIVPALDLACVKAPFSDAEPRPGSSEQPQVEHMWLSEIEFDGQCVSGVLLNAPNWLKSVKEGDAARLPVGQISDWMYAVAGEVFGAHTVNLLRSRMGRGERQQHDAAWGLNFGDPNQIRLSPEPKQGGFFQSWFGKKQPAEPGEHPMSLAMAPSLREQLAKNPSLLTTPDDRGWTLLHQEAAAGSLATVQVLLAAGANRQALTKTGQTPLQLARVLGWPQVVALLEA